MSEKHSVVVVNIVTMNHSWPFLLLVAIFVLFFSIGMSHMYTAV